MFAWRSAVPDRYDAEARILLTVNDPGGPSLDEEQASLASRIYAELADTRPIRAGAIERSGLDIDLADAGNRFDVRRESPPGFLAVVGRGPTGAEAAALADAMAQTLVDEIELDRTAETAPSGRGASEAGGSGAAIGAIGERREVTAELIQSATAPSQRAAPVRCSSACAAGTTAVPSSWSRTAILCAS